MEKYPVDVVVMSNEFVDAGARLKAKNVNAVVVAGQSKALVPRKLAGCRYPALTHKQTLFTDTLLAYQVNLIQFNKPIV